MTAEEARHMWIGIQTDGKLVRVKGDWKMAEWAKWAGKEVTVGWTDHCTLPHNIPAPDAFLSGARLVRPSPGERPSDVARKAGWEDLARALEGPITPEEINALPERIRRHIHDLATISDPAGMVQEIASLKDQVAELVETRATALREHANEKLKKIDKEFTRRIGMSERMFPIQDGPWIPWSVAEQVYEVYSYLYGTSQSLEGLAERHGFGVAEVEVWLSVRQQPQAQWRDLAAEAWKKRSNR
ncbi:hypothetical protein LCGC14_0552230 [marine sediment metagenome]|uniref:Uncharacterized protein n=1 Tax=marine sediment metagenome TaxID=412755 RepID=A0A0F9RPG1_9ZZZZ